MIGAYNRKFTSEDLSVSVIDAATGLQTVTLSVSPLSSEHDFGKAVAVSGTTAVVGAPKPVPYGVLTAADAGAACVFDTEMGLQTVQLLADESLPHPTFGSAVAVSGKSALVAAPEDTYRSIESGVVHIFDTVSGEQTHKLTPDAGYERDNQFFGSSVALSGTIDVIGAPMRRARLTSLTRAWASNWKC